MSKNIYTQDGEQSQHKNGATQKDFDAGAQQIRLADLADRPVWLCWKSVEEKAPLNGNTGGGDGSSTNPDTWASRAIAEKTCRQRNLAGVGISLGIAVDNYILIGVDLDTCYDGVFTPWAQQALDRIKTYSEISPSGTGAKLYCLVDKAILEPVRILLGTDENGDPKGAQVDHARRCAS